MTTRADTSTSTRQEIETRLDAFYAAWQARDGAGMRALFGGGDRLLVWGTTRDERIEGRGRGNRNMVLREQQRSRALPHHHRLG